jgi:hypothetical protein
MSNSEVAVGFAARLQGGSVGEGCKGVAAWLQRGCSVVAGLQRGNVWVVTGLQRAVESRGWKPKGLSTPLLKNCTAYTTEG